MTTEEFMEKTRRFCSWRERCSKEVEEKLKALGANERQIVAIAGKLKKEGFLDNQRFAHAYARGKFENNRWGKIKIKAELLRRNISNDCIRKALDGIEEERYRQTLQALIKNKIDNLASTKKGQVRQKAAAYCIQKGYEPALVWETLNAEHQTP